MTTRTQDDLLTRYIEITAHDPIYWRRSVLILPMTTATRRKAAPGITDDDLAGHEPLTFDALEADARLRLDSTISKIRDHRATAVYRTKLTEYAWVLGRDDVVAAMDAAADGQFGAAAVRAFADGMGWPFIAGLDDITIDRMSRGEPCVDGCTRGCQL